MHHVNEDEFKNIHFEVIEQADDTITIMIPTRPDDYTPDQNERAKQVADQTVDFMYSHGVPGFLIPGEDLRWVLLNMRRSWFAHEGISPSTNEV